MGTKTVSVEELACKGELEEESVAVKEVLKQNIEFSARRFSFFKKPTNLEFLTYLTDKDYLGYAIFIEIKVPGRVYHYVYESVLIEPAFTDENLPGYSNEALQDRYLHCCGKYTAWVGTKRFKIRGSFFSQQSGITNVCAHAALRWVLNNFPDRAEEIITSEDINRVLKINHSSKKAGDYGLTIDNLIEVIQKYGYKCTLADFEKENSINPGNYIYSIIESGYPVLVCFNAEKAKHVICVVGHTSNSDMWDAEARLAYSGMPGAEYLPSNSWVDHFVIHDDNYGPYFCMPVKALSEPCNISTPFQITQAIGIIPSEVSIFPHTAELNSSFILRQIYENVLKDCYWMQVLRYEDKATGKWIVLRTLLVNRTSYISHLNEIEDTEGNILAKSEKRLIAEKLPEHFWLTEVSLTDLYTANKHKLGEILYKSNDPSLKDQSEQDMDTEHRTINIFKGCILLRLPGNIIIPNVSEEDNSIGAHFYETSLTGHVPIFRPCGKRKHFEW